MAEQNENRKQGRPQKYLFLADWTTWLKEEWTPFRTNDLPHLKNDVAWLKRLCIGIVLALIAAAIAVILKG